MRLSGRPCISCVVWILFTPLQSMSQVYICTHFLFPANEQFPPQAPFYPFFFLAGNFLGGKGASHLPCLPNPSGLSMLWCMTLPFLFNWLKNLKIIFNTLSFFFSFQLNKRKALSFRGKWVETEYLSTFSFPPA